MDWSKNQYSITPILPSFSLAFKGLKILGLDAGFPHQLVEVGSLQSAVLGGQGNDPGVAGQGATEVLLVKIGDQTVLGLLERQLVQFLIRFGGMKVGLGPGEKVGDLQHP